MTSVRFSLEARLGAFDLSVKLEAKRRPVAIVGPNGSGKTTLLRLLCGALTPLSGRFELEGRALYDSRLGIDIPPESRKIGYVPQGSGLFPHLDVLDNVAFSSRWGASPKGRERARRAAQQMLDRLGCSELAVRRAQSLSGGERQKVALARALSMDPALMLLDEPLSALDPGARRRTRLFLAQQLSSWGRPALMVTHDARDVAEFDALVLVMDAGRAVQTGTLSALRARPVNEFVEEFAEIGSTAQR